MRWRASYLDTAGTILLALGEFTKAKVRLEEALALPATSNDPQLKTYLRNHLALAHLGSGEREKAKSVFNATEGTLNSGLVAIESHLVEAILLMASGKSAEAGKRLVIMEKESSDRSLTFYNRMARHVMDSLEKKLSIPACILNAMGARGDAD
jgi:tetratricopeptide (TPR) repeat protein